MKTALDSVRDQAKALIRWMDAFAKAKDEKETAALCGDIAFMEGAVDDLRDALRVVKNDSQPKDEGWVA
jgi:hypothetical protein